MTRVRLISVLGASALLALPLAAGMASAGTPSKRRPPVSLALAGAGTKQVTACGSAQRATVAGVGRKIVARVTVRARPRKKVSLTVERCQAGQWGSPAVTKVGNGPGLHSHRVGTSTEGDYRLTASVGGARSAPAYLRVGQGSDAVLAAPAVFEVKNTNTSAVSCTSDGKGYEVKGTIIGPKAALAGGGAGGAIAVYLHGFGLGEWFWDFQAVPGYDYANELAALGHTSLILDRLGYDRSGHPDGNEVCLGAHADAAHQIIGQLRKGSYSVSGGSPVTFSKVALAGHSAGGAIAQVEAYSYKDIDALAVLAYADLGGSPRAPREFSQVAAVCARGGVKAEPSDPKSPAGYAYFGQTETDFKEIMFHQASEAVVAAATKLRNPDPCGDSASFPAAIATSQSMVDEISVPVLLVYASDDELFPASSAGPRQRDLYKSSDVTLETIQDAGHALTLEQTAPRFRKVVSDWLKARGF